MDHKFKSADQEEILTGILLSGGKDIFFIYYNKLMFF